MKKPSGKIFLKILKISGAVTAGLLLLMFILPYLFPDFVSTKIKEWARSSIKGEMNFSKARLSFFKHFPSLTLTLYDLTLKGSKPFQQEVLISGDEVSLGVNLSSVFSHAVKIDKIFLSRGFVNIQVDSSGRANYNVYASKEAEKKVTTEVDTSSASLKLEKIVIEKSLLVYNDRSIPMRIQAKGFNYEGTGDLDTAVFDLNSHIQIDSLDFNYDHLDYVESKKLAADLVTKINTNSLALVFEKNELKINRLPVSFNGRFAFLPNGYDMDLQLKSIETDLHDIVTALPPEMNKWLESTEVKGFGDINAAIKGKYIASKNSMPDASVDIKIRDGYIAHSKSPVPVKNLFLNMQSRLPGLNMDSLFVNIDSIFFNIDKDYVSSIVQWKGMSEPVIKAKMNAEIDLEKLDRAIGIQGFDLKGKYTLHLLADGKYAKGIVKTGLRKIDTAIVSIPSFNLSSSLQNGYFKYASLPQAVNNISFKLDAACKDNNYKHTNIALENLNATVLNNIIQGYIRITNAKDFPVDAHIKGTLKLSDITSFYPLDSLDLAGDLNMDITTKGKYIPAKKVFPVTQANLQLNNGSIHTKYYPHPIQKIQVSAAVSNAKGSFRDLKVAITPVSFEFEGQPFLMKADLQDFDNLRYAIVSKGTLDIGKIYEVFALKGYNITGQLETNLSLRGSQADAVAGRYNRLNNSGTMKLREVALSSDLFPLPLSIHSGLFRFDQDKIWFDAFNANYGKSFFTLKGYLFGVINYLMETNQSLQGNFELSSNLIVVDELMAFSSGNSNASQGDSPPPPSASGVILVPAEISVGFNAAVKKVQYNGLEINDFKGEVVIDSGKVKLNQTGFNLIGAPVIMDGSYESLSPSRALFNYHINAADFDVKKAYQEIKLFHDMVSAASKAEGIVSLDYGLNGKLDDHMNPVYPSLKGAGVLSVKKVKVKGLKLFSAVSRETGKDIKDPDLSKVDIKSSINNNLITIERTKMRVAGFRPRFQGQVSFDGKLNLTFRLGLPPLGIIGIPLKVTGTQQNPIVKIRKGNKEDELEETEDKEE